MKVSAVKTASILCDQFCRQCLQNLFTVLRPFIFQHVLADAFADLPVHDDQRGIHSMPDVGSRCGALRIRDAEHNWRIMYRIDSDAIVILEVYSKKTRKNPDKVMERCSKRLKQYDEVITAAKKQTGK